MPARVYGVLVCLHFLHKSQSFTLLTRHNKVKWWDICKSVDVENVVHGFGGYNRRRQLSCLCPSRKHVYTIVPKWTGLMLVRPTVTNRVHECKYTWLWMPRCTLKGIFLLPEAWAKDCDSKLHMGKVAVCYCKLTIMQF